MLNQIFCEERGGVTKSIESKIRATTDKIVLLVQLLPEETVWHLKPSVEGGHQCRKILMQELGFVESVDNFSVETHERLIKNSNTTGPLAKF